MEYKITLHNKNLEIFPQKSSGHCMNFDHVKKGFEPSKRTAAWISRDSVFAPNRNAERAHSLDNPNLRQNWDFTTDFFPNQFIHQTTGFCRASKLLI